MSLGAVYSLPQPFLFLKQAISGGIMLKSDRVAHEKLGLSLDGRKQPALEGSCWPIAATGNFIFMPADFV